MRIGDFEIGRKEISIALMIMFAMVAMFWIGYYYSYSKAVAYANEQIKEKIDKFTVEKQIISNESKFFIDNIMPSLEGINNEKVR